MLLLLLMYVNHIIAGVNAITIVIKRHLARVARYVARLQILKKSLA